MRDIRRTVFENPILDLLETYLHIGAARDFEWVDSGRGSRPGQSAFAAALQSRAGRLRPFSEQRRWNGSATPTISSLLGVDPTQVTGHFERAEAFLSVNCGLRLNAESRRFASESEGFDFLGFWFRDGRRTMTPQKLDQKRQKMAEILRQNPSNLKDAVRELSETMDGWRAYYGKSPDTRDQLAMLEQHLADVLQPWLARFRSRCGQGAGRSRIEGRPGRNGAAGDDRSAQEAEVGGTPPGAQPAATRRDARAGAFRGGAPRHRTKRSRSIAS